MTTQSPPRVIPEWKRVKRRRRRRDLVVVLVFAALVAAGFAAYGIAHGLASGPLAVATQPKGPLFGGEVDDALVQGTLGGSVGTGADEGKACFWLDLPDGQRGYVVWPHGWSADDHPLRILNDWGKTVATVGDRIQGGGASSAGADQPIVDVLGCPATQSVVGFNDVSLAP
jgi:hypothetical protein